MPLVALVVPVAKRPLVKSTMIVSSPLEPVMVSFFKVALVAAVAHGTPFWTITESVGRRVMIAVSPAATVTAMMPVVELKVQGVPSAVTCSATDASGSSGELSACGVRETSGAALHPTTKAASRALMEVRSVLSIDCFMRVVTVLLR
jgi:hypothetical protein